MPQDDNTERPGDATARNEALDALRREIDALDDDMLALMERRVAAAMGIAELKRSDPDMRLRLRPAREAAVIDRLVAQSTVSSERAVRHVWREIMASCLDLQVHTELVLHAEQRPAELADAARRRFGCAARMIVAASPGEALEAARSREAVAVVEVTQGSDWWTGLVDERGLAPFECLRGRGGAVIGVALGRLHAEDLEACPQILVSSEAGGGEVIASAGDVHLLLVGGRDAEAGR